MAEGTTEVATKRCKRCGIEKPASDFYKAQANKDLLTSNCKTCRGELNRLRQQKDPDAYRRWHAEYAKRRRAAIPEDQRRWARLWRRYKLSQERYEEILAAQGGRCAVCKRDEFLFVDHDHACCPSPDSSCGNCVRGLLCRACNWSLGFLQENPATIRALLSYVTEPIIPFGGTPESKNPLRYTRACGGCGEEFATKRWSTKYCSRKCSLDYYKLRAKQDRAANPRRRVRGTCSLPDCGQPHQAQGFCRKHYLNYYDANLRVRRSSRTSTTPAVRVETLF